MFFRKKRIFLDYAGGEMNPSGIHKEGLEAKRRLEEARAKAAKILKCQARDIIFTSGGTESNNLAILGVWKPGMHVVVGDTEHPSVAEPAKEIQRRGGELTITSDPLKHIKDNTGLVSLAYANNETGEINNVSKIARLIKERRQKAESKFPLIHTDATSAYEYLEVDINKVPADLISLEKILVVRPNVEIRPLVYGGGQERGLRSGTQNVSAIEELVRDLESAVKNREGNVRKLSELKNYFIAEAAKLPGIVINTPSDSLPNIVSVSFPGKLHEFLAIKLDERGIAVSTGSSCDSGKSEPDKEALRFSFSPKTSEREIRETLRILREIML